MTGIVFFYIIPQFAQQSNIFSYIIILVFYNNGYPKSLDEVKYLTQYLKISLDIVLDAKTFDNQVKRICKLACKDAHADCSASLCPWQRSAKRHLEKGDARKEYTSGFSASFKFRYLPLISSKIRSVITP